MKKIHFSILFFFLLLFLTSGCKKECKNIELPVMSGGFDYSVLKEAIIFENHSPITSSNSLNYYITDSIEFDSLILYKNVIGNVDFSKYSLIGIKQPLNPCVDYIYDCQVFISKNDKTIKMKLNYSLHGQCAGSGQGIGNKILEKWAKIPKSNYKIIYEVTDINPI